VYLWGVLVGCAVGGVVRGSVGAKVSAFVGVDDGRPLGWLEGTP